MEMYKTTNTKIDTDFIPTHNKIRVDYVKKQGATIYVTKVQKHEFSETCMLMDSTNFSYTLKPMARANKKTLAMVQNEVETIADKIFKLYEEGTQEGGSLKLLKLELLDLSDKL